MSPDLFVRCKSRKSQYYYAKYAARRNRSCSRIRICGGIGIFIRLSSHAKDAYPDQSVLIRGDGEGQYQAVIDVMNACHQVQIRKFSLAFQPLETSASGSP